MLIKITDVSFEYIKGKKVLRDLSYNFAGGIFYALCGPNGAGKTTLLKIISGIYKNYSGSVEFISDSIKFEIRNSKAKEISSFISYVPSDVYLPFNFSVEDILLMGRRRFLNIFDFYTNADHMYVKQVACEFKIEDLMKRNFNELSNGERQMVLIAQSVVQHTPFILVDEPTSHLDIRHQIDILTKLKEETVKSKKTVIAVMHNLRFASYFSDKMVFMKGGRIYLDINAYDFKNHIDTISDIYEITPHEMERFL